MTTAKKIRIGLAGCGGRGRGMLSIMLKGFPEHIVLAAVSDPSVEASAQAQAQYPECKIFSDADVMIRESDIDVAVITTPANDHARYAVSALKKKFTFFQIYHVYLICRKLMNYGKLHKKVPHCI